MGPLSWGAGPDRWKAGRDAQASAEEQDTQARQALMDALTPPSRTGESTSVWLQRVDEVLARAEEAASWARDERRKIPLVGAERAVVIQLLHVTTDPSASILTWASRSMTLHCTMESERCVGVYLVGRTLKDRVLNAPEQAEETAALLSQALGQPASLPAPPVREGGRGPTTSTWKVGEIPIVARWRNSDLMELRVGNVKP